LGGINDMSEQRRYRKELRQGLHQFLMQIYMAYLETHEEDKAKELVREVMIEQFTYFSSTNITVNQATETLLTKVNTLTEKMNTMKEFDSQLYYAEKIDALNEAISILETKIEE
jgi:hypothetical protein